MAVLGWEFANRDVFDNGVVQLCDAGLEVTCGTDEDRVAVKGSDAQLVLLLARAQVFGDDFGTGGIRLGAGKDLAFPPGLDRVRADRHDRVSGVDQQVRQPPVRAFDFDWNIVSCSVFRKSTNQGGDPVGGMIDGLGRPPRSRGGGVMMVLSERAPSTGRYPRLPPSPFHEPQNEAPNKEEGWCPCDHRQDVSISR